MHGSVGNADAEGTALIERVRASQGTSRYPANGPPTESLSTPNDAVGKQT